MAAIDYVVFKNGIINNKQLFHAIKTNFEGMGTVPTGEEIKQLLVNRCPKFGNDDDEADLWAYKIEDFLGSSYHNNFKNSHYKKGPIPACYELSLSSVTGNIPFGLIVGALLNGRKAKEPLNNGILPCNGTERLGLTAVINSVGKMPSIWFQKGAILNIRLAKQTLTTKEGKHRVAAIIKTLSKKKGAYIQFNVVDNDILIDAQRIPEKYPDLMIRIAGYSALFTSLSHELQNDLIGRVQFNM